MGKQFFVRLTRGVIRLRWPLLLLILGLNGYFVLQLQKVQIDSSNENWLVEGDESLRLIQKFNELFGNDDFVYVLYEPGDFFRTEPIRRTRDLAAALEDGVPHLVDMTWLGNAEYIEGKEDVIEIEDLMPALPTTPEALAALRHKALAEPTYVDSLISADGNVTGVMLEMDTYPADSLDPRKDIAPVVREIVAQHRQDDGELVAVGGPIMDYDLDVLTANEGSRLGLICLLVQMAILAWVGRGARGVFVPAAIVTCSVIWTFGLVALVGFKVNILVGAVPVLLICVGIGDAMHVISEFNDQRRQGFVRAEAMERAMAHVGWPCVLTSVTTAIGFLAFLAANIKPFRDMGIYAASGCALAVILTFLLVPILYSWGRPEAPEPLPEGAARGDVFDRLLRGIARLVIARPRTLVTLFTVLFVASVAGYSRMQIDTGAAQMFSKKTEIRQALDFVDSRMGGSSSIEIMLDTGRPDGALDPAFLSEMDALDRFLNEHDLTTKTNSFLDILRQMRKAFHENRAEFYDVPSSKAEAAQYLLLYEMSGGQDKGKLLTHARDVARVTARTTSLSTLDATRLYQDVEAFANDRFSNADVSVEFTGTMTWVVAMTELVGIGQRRSFAAAAIAIGILMMLVLRSVRLGLISMIPNVFPVLITLGFMGFAGIAMDIMMMTFSALIIGVAVDDTIHFFVRYKREFERLGRYDSALEATLTTVGRPITFTTLTLTLGFAVLAASSVNGLVHFGILSGFAFVWALLADFLFAPAMLLLIRPLGPERAP